MSRTAALALLAVLALVLVACGGDESKPSADAPAPAQTPIRIGTKNFTEQFILGELYSQALKAKGFKVELKGDIGSTEIAHRALTAGSLDMYPEYIGILLSVIAKVTDRPKSAGAAYRIAKDFEERSGYTLLRPTPFSNANALAVEPAFARRHSLHSIADLRRLKHPRLAAQPEFRNRYEGMTGLRSRYGLRNLKLLPLEDPAERYPMLDAGKADVTVAYTTDGQLADDRYVLLDDPRGVFAAGHAAPVVHRDLLKAHGPGLASAVDAVSAKLTTVAMRQMNKAVDLDKRKPADVAREFLRSQGLVGAPARGG
jgi:osmoprotectant transport system substrate-binding protein